MGIEADVTEAPPEAKGIMFERAEAANMDYPLTLDSTRIRTELGYAETISEREALERTIAWELSQN
jgi:nucleoside-diphosphate-sugar epimerase